MTKRWTCKWCNQEWPAYTTIEAYRMHKKANEIHPNEPCKPSKRIK